MAEPTDHELLTRFACTGDEAAFAALVTRHVNLVYSAALRFTRDTHRAEEITQAVFIILARKAGGISAKVVLTGWLYQAARLTAANALKENFRRQQREQQAYMESTLNSADTEDAWQQLAPVLDEAMSALRTADRDAVLLRYFENKPLAEVGAALGVSEDAARVRVNRALEKLRSLLAKQGVTLGATAIAGAVTANAVSAAPVALATTITTAALAGATTTAATILTTAKIITMTTLQKITVTAALAAAIGAGVYEAKQAHDVQNELQKLQAQQAPMTEQIHQLQAERDKATNANALLKDELAKNERNKMELMKLRGQAGQVQTAVQQLAKAQAALKNQKTGMPAYLTNAMAMGLKTALTSQKKSAAARIARMKQALNLSDDQAQAITDIMFRYLERGNQFVMQAMSSGDMKAVIASDSVSLQPSSGADKLSSPEDEIKAQLTPDQLAEYDAFKKTEAVESRERSASAEVQRMTEDLSLTPDQQQQIHDLVLQERSDKTGTAFAGNAAELAATRNSSDYGALVRLSMQQQLENLTNRMNLFQPVLTPAQFQQYQEREQERIEMMKSAFSMFLPQTNSAAAQ
jgi:RNA polymerase sigma factor (sigma-70 family)